MRFLICFPEDGETNQALIDGCKANGYEVDFVCAHKYPNKLLTTLSQNTYDIVLCSRTVSVLPSLVRARDKTDAKFCVWNVDERPNVSDWRELNYLHSFVDYLFVVSDDLHKWKYVNKNTHFLPQGVQVDRYNKPKLSMDDYKTFESDVTFIGNVTQHHKDRMEILGYIDQHFDLKFFTAYGDDHNKACNVAKVNIGMAHSPWIKKYASVRDWKILAADGVLLTRWHPGYDELFPGVETYRTKEECAQKISMMLSDNQHYKKKAEELGNWARSSQTYAHRLKRMVEIVEG